MPLLCHFLQINRENRFSSKSGNPRKIRVLENGCFIRDVFEPRMLHHHQSLILSMSWEFPEVPSATEVPLFTENKKTEALTSVFSATTNK